MAFLFFKSNWFICKCWKCITISVWGTIWLEELFPKWTTDKRQITVTFLKGVTKMAFFPRNTIKINPFYKYLSQAANYWRYKKHIGLGTPTLNMQGIKENEHFVWPPLLLSISISDTHTKTSLNRFYQSVISDSSNFTIGNPIEVSNFWHAVREKSGVRITDWTLVRNYWAY